MTEGRVTEALLQQGKRWQLEFRGRIKRLRNRSEEKEERKEKGWEERGENVNRQ